MNRLGSATDVVARARVLSTQGANGDSSRPDRLTVGEILDLPAVVPLVPTVARALDSADSTIYQLAAEERLGMPTVRIGRRLCVRVVDLWTFLGLLPLISQNDNAAGGNPTALVESTESTSTQTGSTR